MTTRFASLAFASLFAGCGAQSPAPSTPPSLAQPGTITATTLHPGSQVTAHRSGPLDPNGTDVTLAVRAARIQLRADASAVTLVELGLDLADVDLPPSKQIPDGLKLRDQSITGASKMKAETLRRTDDALDVHPNGRFQFHSAMVLSDGTLSELGATDVDAASSQVHVTLENGVARITLEQPPGGACGSVGDLLTLTDCTLFVETDATLTE